MTKEGLVEDIFNNAHQIFKKVIYMKSRLFANYGMHRAEAEMVLILLNDGKRTIKDLAEIMGITSGAVTQFVESVYQKGWINREHSTKDRRLVYVSMTKKGIEIFKEIHKIMLKKSLDIFNDISVDELKVFQNIQKKIINKFLLIKENEK